MKTNRFASEVIVLFSFTILTPLSFAFAQVPPPIVLSTSLPTSAFGQPVSYNAVSGGVTPYVVTATGLPPGVSINPSTGVLSGTPSPVGVWPSPTNPYNVVIHVQDAVGQTADATVPWNLTSTFTYTRTPSGASVGSSQPVTFHIHGVFGVDFCAAASSYSIQLANSSNQWYTDANNNIITTNLTSPTFSHAVGDVVDDTWTVSLAPGSYGSGYDGTSLGWPYLRNPGVVLKSCAGYVSDGQIVQETPSIDDPFTVVAPPSISTTNPLLTPGVVGQAYSTTLQATSGIAPYTWSVASGSLPDGLLLGASGVISGTPTAATTSTFTVQVTDAVGQVSSSKAFTIAVAESNAPPSIIASLPTSAFGQPVSYNAVSGGVTPYVVTATGLPPGVSINPSTGVLSGTPSPVGVWPSPTNPYNVVIHVQDAVGQTADATVPWNLTSTFTYTRTPSGASVGSSQPVTFHIHGVFGVDFCAAASSYSIQLANSSNQWYTDANNNIITTNLTSPTFSHAVGDVVDDTWTVSLAPGSYGSGYDGTSLGWPYLRNPGVVLKSCAGYVSDGQIVQETPSIDDPFTVVAPPSISTTNPLLTPGVVGQAYSTTLQATSGIAPYTWSVASGSLPDGLLLGASGVISGTPTAATTSTFTVQVTDAVGQVSSSKAFTIAVAESNAPPSIIASLPTSAFGQPVSYNAVSGGVTPYVVTATGLPPGVSINPSTGVLSGTPSPVGVWPSPTNPYNVVIHVQDAVGQTADATVPWNLTSTFTYTRTPSGASVGSSQPVTFHIHGVFGVDFCAAASSYSIQLANSSNQWYTDANNNIITTNLTSPTFSHAVGDVVDDTWTVSLAPGSYGSGYDGTSLGWPYLRNPGVVLKSCAGYVSDGQIVQETPSIDDPFTVVAPPSISTTNPLLTPGVVGQAYSTTLQATSGIAPYTWSVASGSLPDGLLLDPSTGIISGIPDVTVSPATFSIQVRDTVGQISNTVAYKMFTFTPITITAPSLPDASIGIPYAQTLQTTNGTAPYVWSIASGNLPAGVTLNNSTGAISGTPTASGTYTFVVRVTDANTITATRSYSINVSSNSPPAIVPIPNQTVNEGQTLSFAVSATDPDGDTLTYSASNLPAGASFDPATRTFTWTPSYGQAGNYTNVEFTVTDSGTPMQLAFEDITISVGHVNRPPVFAPVGAWQASTTVPLSFSVSATDPDGDAVTLSAANIPQGATFNPSTGIFSWTPAYNQTGNYTVTFTATDNGTPTIATSSLDVVISVASSSPTTLTQNLTGVITSSNLPGSQQNSYLANLLKVPKFINDGKVTPAINQLNAFIQKVNQDFSQGKLTKLSGMSSSDRLKPSSVPYSETNGLGFETR